MREAKKPGDYVAIGAWGLWLGSHAYFIENEQLKALDAKAPADALFLRRGSVEWATVRSLTPDHVFRSTYAAALRVAGLEEAEAWEVTG